MAYLARPATQAKLQRLQQAQDARLAAATQPTPAEAAITNAAKETCRRMVQETQKRADIILEMAQQQALEIIARRTKATPPAVQPFGSLATRTRTTTHDGAGPEIPDARG